MAAGSADERMVQLIEELSNPEVHDPKLFQTYAQLQHELLRRVDEDNFFGDNAEAKAEFLKQETSVFDRVAQHQTNEDSGGGKLSLFAEQFDKVHGKDHKTFTEEWLSERLGYKMELERVMENSTFQDFVGVYDVFPMSAYVASKLIIDESDFMGLFDLSAGPARCHDAKTYHGVDESGASDEHQAEMMQAQQNCEQHDVEKCAQAVSNSASRSFCCSSAEPHVLGEGQFLQMRLRKENVAQYMDNSLISKRLKELIPDDPKEPIYIFTVSANGIMRFFPWGGIQRKLWHGYGDSETVQAFPKNIAHAGQYGCFCFGVIYKEKENYRPGDAGGRTVIMRYNRWATDNAPIYSMIRKLHADKSAPKQESCLQHYRSALLRKCACCAACC